MRSGRTLSAGAWVMLMLAGVMPLAHASSLSQIDAQSAAAWADRHFEQALAERRLTGAVVTVVKDGAVLLSKGYGYADYARRLPMDPEHTAIRVCSVSKTMVATALMQLIDRGAIASLDDPANKYLERIKLPRFEGVEITLRHLTSHRAGFEDSFFGAGTLLQATAPLDSKTIQQLLPRVVRKPGTLSVYSNASAALQGLIIEDVSGMSLRHYLASNVFVPLGMTSTFLNDGPPAPRGHAQPYVIYEDGTARAVPVVAKSPMYAPSGGVYSTANDMARFLMAHLDAGRSTPDPILAPATFATMHTLAVRNHPAVGGIGVQFFIDDINGTRVVSHGCGLPGFTSYLAFVPASNVGLFVNVVSARASGGFANCCGRPGSAVAPNFAVKFFYEFIKEYIGFGALPAGEPPPTDLDAYAGAYRPDRRTYTNMLAALDLLDAAQATVVVSDAGDGTLKIGENGPYRSYIPGVLQRDMHPARIYGFDFAANGQAQRMLWSNAQTATRLGFWDNPLIARNLLLLHAGLCLTGLLALAWPVRRRDGQRWGRCLPAVMLICLVLAFVAAKLGFAPGENIEDAINVGSTGRLSFILLACNLLGLAALAACLVTVRSWSRAYWGEGVRGTLRRAHFSLIALSGLACLVVLATFHLLGAQLP